MHRPPLDICRTFGPLASMHAALDQAGIGMSCGIVARFPDRSPAEVADAIARVRQRLPILDTNLAWIDGRPTLVFDGEARNRHDTGVAPLLATPNDHEGSSWRYRLIEDGRDSWLHAVWRHAAADGLSMLGVAEAIAADMAGRDPVPIRRPLCAASSPRSFARWLPRFLFEQQRTYVSATDPKSLAQTSWIVTDGEDRDAVLARAASLDVGMAAWLGASVAAAFAAQQGRPRGTVLLNIPIARRTLAETGGFGFGVGSIRLPTRTRRDSDAVAVRLAARLRRAVDLGWDRNLERLLGPNPSRHRRFARLQAGQRADPNVTVSWKGVQPTLCGQADLRDMACFAGAPTLHVSAHADATGLSLSVTSPASSERRHALLEEIADRLGCRGPRTIRNVEAIGALRPAVPTPAPAPSGGPDRASDWRAAG
jgi:hypothetical protein